MEDPLYYDYEHEDVGVAVMVAEDMNLALSGGNDQRTVLHDLRTGQTRHIIPMQNGGLSCIHRLGIYVAFGDENFVWFYDLLEQCQVSMENIQINGLQSLCMQLGKVTGANDGESKVTLFVGGMDSSTLTLVNLPDSFLPLKNYEYTLSEDQPNHQNYSKEFKELFTENKLLTQRNLDLQRKLSKTQDENVLLKNKSLFTQAQMKDLLKELEQANQRKELFKTKINQIEAKLVEIQEKYTLQVRKANMKCKKRLLLGAICSRQIDLIQSPTRYLTLAEITKQNLGQQLFKLRIV
jgi:hypothetical protein